MALLGLEVGVGDFSLGLGWPLGLGSAVGVRVLAFPSSGEGWPSLLGPVRISHDGGWPFLLRVRVRLLSRSEGWLSFSGSGLALPVRVE